MWKTNKKPFTSLRMPLKREENGLIMSVLMDCKEYDRALDYAEKYFECRKHSVISGFLSECEIYRLRAILLIKKMEISGSFQWISEVERDVKLAIEISRMKKLDLFELKACMTKVDFLMKYGEYVERDDYNGDGDDEIRVNDEGEVGLESVVRNEGLFEFEELDLSCILVDNDIEMRKQVKTKKRIEDALKEMKRVYDRMSKPQQLTGCIKEADEMIKLHQL
eukprot:TRINITY_DN2262_c0_g1_i1.p2 TRINITY_DN2262_c0_g1~~TRINITY_DN2262_c0_g1_i1.p2  ORF type:complete len:222 (+),score=64.56 TRINITY_DN2262_c0_g1_i1:785-1450(+)